MRLTAISWDEITHVEKGRYSCRISTADGRRIRVNSADYSHGTDFVDQVELEVTDRGLQVEKT
jgi:hypothetical protein